MSTGPAGSHTHRSAETVTPISEAQFWTLAAVERGRRTAALSGSKYTYWCYKRCSRSASTA
jgi:hypothetical protein